EQHGGTLVAESEGIGHGTRFTLRVPAQVPRREPVDTQAPAPAMAPRRVLVVDDNRDSADTMVELLRLMGHDAQAVYRSDEALRRAEAFDPQLVLLDINMPDADGYATLRALRAQPRTSGAYVCAMTGYGQQADRERALSSGF